MQRHDALSTDNAWKGEKMARGSIWDCPVWVSNQNPSVSERRNHRAVRRQPEAAHGSAAELLQGSWCNAIWDPKSPRICSVPIRPDQILFSE